MSKFLKFIVHFAVICTIVCVLGLALPPFFGVRTVIMDSTDKATNLPLGSVTYAIPVRTEEVTAGSPILVQEDDKTYKYNLVSVNRENNTGTVIDTTTSAQESITVSVKNWVPKIVITIPLVGYLLVATESVEGLIVLGLLILFLIILYVIAELWRKDPEDDEYEDLQGDTRHVKSSRELKAEEKARAKRMKQEDKEKITQAEEILERLKVQRGGNVLSIHKKMANDPKLLQAFSQQFAICKQDITHIPAKYMELMLMLMGCCAGNSVTIKTHGELAVKKGATMDEIGEVLRLVFFYYGASAIIPAVELFEELEEG